MVVVGSEVDASIVFCVNGCVGVYLQVTRLCDLSCDGDSVTSVSWSERVSGSKRGAADNGG